MHSARIRIRDLRSGFISETTKPAVFMALCMFSGRRSTADFCGLFRLLICW